MFYNNLYWVKIGDNLIGSLSIYKLCDLLVIEKYRTNGIIIEVTEKTKN